MFDWQHWKQRVVRDLAWVIASPPLASGKYDGVAWWNDDFLSSEYQACLPALEALDKDPSPLLDHLAQQKSKALGHRFEAFVAYWIEISPNFELLYRSVQLHSDGRTLGELDFILRDKRSQKVIHLEVAVKFYMGLQPLGKPENWHGPNLKDSLAKKLNHLKTKQTQLSLQHPELLPVAIDERCCCLKGRLFYPEAFSQLMPPQLVPEGISSGHLQGYFGIDVQQFAESLKAEYISLTKQQWFTELDESDVKQLAATPVSEQPDRPQCFAIVREGREVGRYFQFPVGYFDAVLRLLP